MWIEKMRLEPISITNQVTSKNTVENFLWNERKKSLYKSPKLTKVVQSELCLQIKILKIYSYLYKIINSYLYKLININNGAEISSVGNSRTEPNSS